MDKETKIKLIGLHLGVTGLTFIACTIVALIVMFFSWLTAEPEKIYINYSTSKAQELSKIENMNYGYYNYVFNSSEMPEVIISQKKENHDGYKEYEKSLYSPIILFANENVLMTDSGFNLSNAKKQIKYQNVTKNLNTILTAIEENKTWQELGINEKCLEGPVTLAVPDIYNPYRNTVKDLFIINLTVDEITTENYKELSERAEKILSKCIQVEDPLSYLVANKGKKVIVVAPEFIVEDNQDGIFRGSGHVAEIIEELFIPVYPTRTTAIYYNVYLKEQIEGKKIEEKTEHINHVILGYHISDYIGFRTKQSNIEGFDSYNLIDNLSISYIDEGVKN